MASANRTQQNLVATAVSMDGFEQQPQGSGSTIPAGIDGDDGHDDGDDAGAQVERSL